jgi:hypothetical protein
MHRLLYDELVLVSVTDSLVTKTELRKPLIEIGHVPGSVLSTSEFKSVLF